MRSEKQTLRSRSLFVVYRVITRGRTIPRYQVDNRLPGHFPRNAKQACSQGSKSPNKTQQNWNFSISISSRRTNRTMNFPTSRS